MFAYSITSASEHGYGVVTDRFLCLLGPEASLELASEVYRLLDGSDATAAAALELLVSRPEILRFAVVEQLDAIARNFAIAVRGTVALELEQASTTRLSGASDAAWISTEARGVNTLRLMLDGDVAPGTQLPIQRGVVATNQLSLDGVAAEAPAAKQRTSKAGLIATALEATAQSARGNGWLLTLPDGSEIDVGLPVVIGRRPWSAESSDRDVVHVVAPASKHEISGTHLELFVSEGVVQARDLNSTNGTVIRTTARAPRLLHSGGITELSAGDILDVGEDFSITLGARE